MPRNPANCASCYFSTEPGPIACARYPRPTELPPWKWCGEWQIDSEKCCKAKGPEILPERDYPAIKLHLAAQHALCLLPKDHKGDHADHTRTWENTDGKVA